MTAESCPDENALARIAEGAPGALVPALEAHLDACESCRRALAAAASTRTLPTALQTHADFRPGTRVGRYELERELGRGGMGVVYMARDVTLDRRVALKLLHARRDEGAQARLLREAQVMARLAHPNVVPVFELGDWAGDVYLVMELVNGVTLQAWLKGAHRSRREILEKFLDADRGLAAAHAAKVVHRDFKPANVLVGLDGRARVTDFGLSRPGPAPTELPPLASPLVTREGALVGTIVYMSPEQLNGKAADERSDQFAFCVSLAEALAGERPFEGESWSALAVSQSKPPRLSGVPRSMRAALRKGLCVEPGQRYTSLTALLDALERSQRVGWKAVAATAAAAALSVGVISGVPALSARIHAHEAKYTMVVTAARDLTEGTIVTFDMLAQRSYPAENVTNSIVPPDSANYIVGQRILVPVMAGDALLWSQFETSTVAIEALRAVTSEVLMSAKDAYAACVKQSHKGHPGTHGTLELSFDIDRDGHALVHLGGLPEAQLPLAECLRGTVEALRFTAGNETTKPIVFPFEY